MRPKSWMHNKYWIFQFSNNSLVTGHYWIWLKIHVSAARKHIQTLKFEFISIHRHFNWVFCGVYNNIFIIRIKSIREQDKRCSYECCMSRCVCSTSTPNVCAPNVSFRFGIRGVFCFLLAYKRFNFPPVVHEPCVYSGQCSMKRCAHFRKRGWREPSTPRYH